jgi:hypothetical protein
MHPYSTDESRVPTYSMLAIIAVVLAWAIVAVTSHLSWPQWLVSAPSMAATFAVVYRAFDIYAWRWPVWRHLGLVGIRDLSGTYHGQLVSTFNDAQGQPVTREITLQVVQSWTRLKIEMAVASGQSSSLSTSALGSVTTDGAASCLTYLYKNRVNPALADADMGDHDGAADLRIYSDGRVKGRYFNSRPRAGTIVAQREAPVVDGGVPSGRES